MEFTSIELPQAVLHKEVNLLETVLLIIIMDFMATAPVALRMAVIWNLVTTSSRAIQITASTAITTAITFRLRTTLSLATRTHHTDFICRGPIMEL